LFAQEKRPNILILFADDHAYQACGFNGNKEVKTPNLDALADQGLTFDNYYNTTAICAASRAQLMTGMLEYKTGVNFTHGGLNKEKFQKSYPVLLQNNGYFIGFFGKFGFGVNDPKTNGDVSLDHNEYSNLPVNEFDIWRGGLEQTKYETAQNKYLATYADKYPHSSRAYGAAAADFFQEAKESGKPFCLSVYFKAPHLPSTPDPFFDEVYKGVAFTKPSNFGPENAKHLSEQARNGRQYLFFFKKYGYNTEEEYQESIRNYYQLIYGVDFAIGMMIKELEKQGLADNTIIIYTSDNGYNMGAHGFGGKTLPYEEASKAPCIIYDPRAPKNKKRTNSLVGNIDIAPTILRYSDVSIPENMDGLPLVELYENETIDIRKSLPLIQTYGSAPVHSLSVNSKEWKYIYWPYEGRGMKASEELYNKINDPLEMDNKATNKKYKKELERMRILYDVEFNRWKKLGIDNNEYKFYKTYFDRTISWEEKSKVLPMKYEKIYEKWLVKSKKQEGMLIK
jgi:arylsulfatase A-like enzyme